MANLGHPIRDNNVATTINGMDQGTKLHQIFLPIDGATYMADRQTKTYVPKYVSMFLPVGLWTMPKFLFKILDDSYGVYSPEVQLYLSVRVCVSVCDVSVCVCANSEIKY